MKSLKKSRFSKSQRRKDRWRSTKRSRATSKRSSKKAKSSQNKKAQVKSPNREQRKSQTQKIMSLANFSRKQPLNFSNFLRFSHFVLENQFLTRTSKINFKKMAKEARRLKSANKPNRRKSVLLSTLQILKEQERDEHMALTELRAQSAQLFSPIFRKLHELVGRKSKQITHPDPLDRYFLKTLLPRTNKPQKIQLSQMEMPVGRSLYLDKYQLQTGPAKLTAVTNQFSPKSLSNDQGSLYVKNRIERVMNEQVLWKLTNINGIGRLLRKVEDRVKSKLDLPKQAGRLDLGSRDFLAQFTEDKEYLKDFDSKWQKQLEDQIVGKKFIDKFEYVEEFISKRRANEFVAHVQQKQKSRLTRVRQVSAEGQVPTRGRETLAQRPSPAEARGANSGAAAQKAGRNHAADPLHRQAQGAATEVDQKGKRQDQANQGKAR